MLTNLTKFMSKKISQIDSSNKYGLDKLIIQDSQYHADWKHIILPCKIKFHVISKTEKMMSLNNESTEDVDALVRNEMSIQSPVRHTQGRHPYTFTAYAHQQIIRKSRMKVSNSTNQNPRKITSNIENQSSVVKFHHTSRRSGNTCSHAHSRPTHA